MKHLKGNIINFILVLIAFIGVSLSILIILPLQIIFRTFSKKYDMCYYFRQLAVALDVSAGAVIFGSKHTISANLGRKMNQEDNRGIKDGVWHSFASMVDYMFGKNHCLACAYDDGLVKLNERPKYNGRDFCSKDS